MAAFVTLKDVVKEYKMGEVTITAAGGVNFEIEKGEFCVIVGPSGAGKTTVLNILGGMDSCTRGSVLVDGRDISKLSPKDLIRYRRLDIGFVFQFYNLVQNLTAKENVELASQICPDPVDAAQMLEEVGLGGRLNNFPAQLSGGEQQRVAIARALAKRPKLLLCDEPTGALVYLTGKSILKLLQDTCRKSGTTVVVITHNSALTTMRIGSFASKTPEWNLWRKISTSYRWRRLNGNKSEMEKGNLQCLFQGCFTRDIENEKPIPFYFLNCGHRSRFLLRADRFWAGYEADSRHLF